jgi:hypothetical protein
LFEYKRQQHRKLAGAAHAGESGAIR